MVEPVEDESQNISDMVSNAFIEFMYRREELSSFVGFYNKLVGLAVKPKDAPLDESLRKEFYGQQIFFMENYLCKMSDYFDIYIDQLVFAVCRVKEDFLKARDYQKANSKLQQLGLTEILPIEVQYEAAFNFGRKDKTEIATYFKNEISFDLVAAAKNWDAVLLSSRIRNLIVHKSSVVDLRFYEYAKEKNLPFDFEVGSYLTMPQEWVVDLCGRVNDCVPAIDAAISEKVEIYKRNRYGHFWFPRSGWATEANEARNE